jgi:copper chaperone NosL
MQIIRLLAVCFLFFPIALAVGGNPPKVTPSAQDKCPVCGMFVAKYPDFMAAIEFRDGSRSFFDGAKDMFKYYFNVEKYNANNKQSDIKDIFVTDYYSMAYIDARTAFYIIGSDVYGPMGRELIPFQNKKDAEVFMKDHSGKRLLSFEDVNLALVQDLD